MLRLLGACSSGSWLGLDVFLFDYHSELIAVIVMPFDDQLQLWRDAYDHSISVDAVDPHNLIDF